MDSVKRLLFTIIMVLFVHTAQAETLNDEGFGAGALNAGVVSANFTNLTVINSTGLGQEYNSNYILKINQTNSFDIVQTQTLTTWTNHTSEANTTAGTAQTLRGSSSVVNASTYFGKTVTFNQIYFDIVTAAAGWTNRLMYWNGTAWNTTTITDGTTNLAVDGAITFTPPADWANNATVNGITNLYWAKLNSTSAVTTNATISLAVPSAIKSLYLNAQPGDTTPAFYIDSNGLVCFNNSIDTTRAIRLGADVDLYRSSANVLTIADTVAITGGVSTSANNTITGQVTNSRATPSPVLLLTGNTAANATVPVQSAPLTRWETRAWNTQGAGANSATMARLGFIAKTDNFTNVTEFGRFYLESGVNKTGTGLGTGAVYANVSWWNFTTVNTTRFNVIGSQQITGGLDEVELTIKSNTTQTADILQIQNSTGTVLLNIEDDGTIHFNDTATVWDDLRVDLNTIGLVPGNTKPDKEVFKNGTYTYSFDASANESVIFSVQMPHSWKEGSVVYPHIHWAPSTTNVGVVVWRLEYTIADYNQTFGNTNIIFANNTSSGTELTHQMCDFTPIDMTGKTISCMLICNLSRMGGDAADTFTGEAKALEFDVHYEIDTVGSRTNITK